MSQLSLSNIKISHKLSMFVAVAALGLIVMSAIVASLSRVQMLEDRATALKWVVETAHGIAKELNKRVEAGELTKEEALEELKTIATSMRYGVQEYLFAYDYNSVAQFNVANPSLNGQDLTNLKDPTGDYPIRKMSKYAVTKGEGTVAYMWPKAGEEVPVQKYVYIKPFRPWDMYIGTGIYMDDFEDDYTRYRNQVLGLGAIVILISGAIVMLISRDITRSLFSLTQSTVKLAEGELETAIDQHDRLDEVGELARAVQVFKEQALETNRMKRETESLLEESKMLSEQQKQLQEEAQEAQRQREQDREESDKARQEEMAQVAQTFESDMGSVSSVLRGLVDNMRSASRVLANAAGTNRDQSDRVAGAAQDTMSNVQSVAGASEELTASIDEIRRQLDSSKVQSAEAVRTINEADQSVGSLAELADQISKITALITDIAEQTNLLALNATIEAARAGESGKGFAVVASEVKSLATQTANAAQEIKAQIDEVQTQTTVTVERIQTVKQVVHANNEVTTAIANSIEEQSAATQEIVENISQAAQGTEDMTTLIMSVKEAIEETEKSANQSSELARELDSACEQLEDSSAGFLGKLKNNAA